MQSKSATLFCTIGVCAALTGASAMAQHPQARHWAIVVHGGAGDISRAALGPERDKAYRASLGQAVKAGAAVLDRGGSSLDAVEAAIRVFEDDPLFNAGRGAVFASDGTNQLDAAIMDGATQRAGAVADVTRTRNPISLARAVMEKTPYVLLVGPGADAFSVQAGLEQEPASYFFTESRWQSLVKQLQKEGKPIPPRPAGAPPDTVTPIAQWQEPADTRRYGTVGVVALDRQGNIAAGTSTGGLQGKMPGRVGDSPLIGAGTYASNQSCAVSGTGVGRIFYPLHRRPRDLRPGSVQGSQLAAGSRRSDPKTPGPHPRRRRRHRHRSRRPACLELQHVRHVSRAAGGRRQDRGSHLQRRAVSSDLIPIHGPVSRSRANLE